MKFIAGSATETDRARFWHRRGALFGWSLRARLRPRRHRRHRRRSQQVKKLDWVAPQSQHGHAGSLQPLPDPESPPLELGSQDTMAFVKTGVDVGGHNRGIRRRHFSAPVRNFLARKSGETKRAASSSCASAKEPESSNDRRDAAIQARFGFPRRSQKGAASRGIETIIGIPPTLDAQDGHALVPPYSDPELLASRMEKAYLYTGRQVDSKFFENVERPRRASALPTERGYNPGLNPCPSPVMVDPFPMERRHRLGVLERRTSPAPGWITLKPPYEFPENDGTGETGWKAGGLRIKIRDDQPASKFSPAASRPLAKEASLERAKAGEMPRGPVKERVEPKSASQPLFWDELERRLFWMAHEMAPGLRGPEDNPSESIAVSSGGKENAVARMPEAERKITLALVRGITLAPPDPKRTRRRRVSISRYEPWRAAVNSLRQETCPDRRPAPVLKRKPQYEDDSEATMTDEDIDTAAFALPKPPPGWPSHVLVRSLHQPTRDQRPFRVDGKYQWEELRRPHASTPLKRAAQSLRRGSARAKHFLLRGRVIKRHARAWPAKKLGKANVSRGSSHANSPFEKHPTLQVRHPPEGRETRAPSPSHVVLDEKPIVRQTLDRPSISASHYARVHFVR
ncbi:MAG: hypothetical protein M1826_003254 [Phylliscum demangeonii]|nr:MAG: hypothetical protein M1826_003254 [Phylliscum demangeonii]